MGIITKNYSVNDKRTQTFHFLSVPRDKKLFYYATSAGRETLNNDYFMERENINVYMVNYIVRGACKLTVDGKELVLNVGDLCFFHLLKHSELFPIAEDTEIIYFHVNGGQTQEIYNAYLEKGEYVLHGVEADMVVSALERFAENVEQEKGFYGQSQVLYGLLFEILKLRDRENLNKTPEFLTKIMDYIMYSCPPPTPAAVAKYYGYSHIYLERLFKQHVGESLRNYILRQKYAFACRFLVDTDLSVEEVAQKVGYADAKGLILLFSKFGNLTPLAYRQANKRRKH